VQLHVHGVCLYIQRQGIWPVADRNMLLHLLCVT